MEGPQEMNRSLFQGTGFDQIKRSTGGPTSRESGSEGSCPHLGFGQAFHELGRKVGVGTPAGFLAGLWILAVYGETWSRAFSTIFLDRTLCF